MLVRIIKWDYPNLRRQTPGGSLVWDGITFTEDPVEVCDHVLVLNHATEPVRVTCSPDRIWGVIGEPPTNFRKPLHRGIPCYSRVYTQDPDRRGARYVHAHGALPWRVERSYDELVAAPPPEKPLGLSCVTSSLNFLPGHGERLAFLDRLRTAGVALDVFGRGLRPIADKWDVVAPYRYSLALENFSGPYYWSEKIIDPLLAWSMPIYYGCTKLDDWLPPESFVQLDIRDPDAPARVQEIVASDLWLRNRNAIAEARRRILDELQLFPYMAGEIRRLLAERGESLRPPRPVWIDVFPDRRERGRLALRNACRRVLHAVGSPRLLALARHISPD